MVRRELRIVRLLDPQMCLGCNFAKVADVEDAHGRTSRMVQCGRLDCDNWDTVDTAAVREVRQVEEG